jgi:hypothetical protein
MSLAEKVGHVAEELRRKGNPPSDKLLRIVQRGIWSLKLPPHVNLGQRVVVELDVPPRPPKGMRDLLVRPAEPRDVPGLSAVVGADPALFRERLERGDLGYVGELVAPTGPGASRAGAAPTTHEIVCYTWFHRGPTPFDEERTLFASLGLDAWTFWSYDAMTREDVRSSGTFAKVFAVGLRELFGVHGARRVLGYIDHINDASLQVHWRFGFKPIGRVTSVAVPGFKWLLWEGNGMKRHRLLLRDSDFALHFPLA